MLLSTPEPLCSSSSLFCSLIVLPLKAPQCLLASPQCHLRGSCFVAIGSGYGDRLPRKTTLGLPSSNSPQQWRRQEEAERKILLNYVSRYSSRTFRDLHTLPLKVLRQIPVLGSAFLAMFAACPSVIEQTTNLTAFRGFAGTSILILVGCATDTARKV